MTTTYGVTAIGNAIVDVLSATTDDFINSQKPFGMVKGGMTLIDQERANALYNLMGPATEVSGGSAANTMAAYASFGGKGAFIGKVADDQLGKIFGHDMRSIGVHFDSTPLIGGKSTAQCMILVTPDAQRTMNTFLGASTQLAESDINEDLIAASQITYLEGYLFDEPAAKQAFFKSAEYTKKHGKQLALTLSDSFCVVRHRDDFKTLIKDHVDILFANEAEIKELTGMDDVDAAHAAVARDCGLTIVTMGKNGSALRRGDEHVHIKAIPPSKLVDTTGAGDAYAAGVLYGLTHSKSLFECGRLGALSASEVISHMGPKPQIALGSLL